MRHSAETDAVFTHAYSFKDGVLQLAERLGHRVDDKPLAAKYLLDQPVSRLTASRMGRSTIGECSPDLRCAR
jgi:mannonate dehydratase